MIISAQGICLNVTTHKDQNLDYVMTEFGKNLIILTKGVALVLKVHQANRMSNETSSCIYCREKETTHHDKGLKKV